MAFASSYGFGTTKLAEVQAVMDGLNLCLNHQLHNIEIEPDSLIVVNWSRGNGLIHWSLIGFLEEFYLYR